MSEEEKKAIASLNEILFENAKEITLYELGINDLKTILNLIKNQQQELKLKDKVIEEICKELGEYDICPRDIDNCPEKNIECNLCWKQYFINKVKGE